MHAAVQHGAIDGETVVGWTEDGMPVFRYGPERRPPLTPETYDVVAWATAQQEHGTW